MRQDLMDDKNPWDSMTPAEREFAAQLVAQNEARTAGRLVELPKVSTSQQRALARKLMGEAKPEDLTQSAPANLGRDTRQASSLIAESKELSFDQMNILKENGYTYNDDGWFDPEGNPVSDEDIVGIAEDLL